MKPRNEKAPAVVGATEPGHVTVSGSPKEDDEKNVRRCAASRKSKGAVSRRTDGRRLSYAERFVHRQMPLRPIETVRLFADLANLKAED